MEQTETADNKAIVLGDEEAKYRLIQNDFLNTTECQPLIDIIETYGAIGDGYGGNPHPHTLTEVFGGYSFEGFRHSQPEMVPGHRQTLAIMLRARDLLKAHFKLPFLWLDYGHLVFRQPVENDTSEQTEDFSHPWHLDNQSHKSRTHTAILYLNEGFTGGLTQFKETDFGPFREVQPEPGKLIAFDGDKNEHGVSKLTSGKRYVLNMWFSTHWRMYVHHRRIFKHL
jgi:hypothetical protein